MFDPDSRYANIETARFELPSGRTVTYARRRLLPNTGDVAVLDHVTVRPGERLDLVAARVYDDSLQYWRLCDANDAMAPDELVERPNRRLRVLSPGVTVAR